MRRKDKDQKTICELFYVCCDDIQDIELSTALKQLLALLSEGIKTPAIIITTEIFIQDTLFKRIYEDMVSFRLTAERFDKLAADYEAKQKRV
ncbi:MAG: hypothetical protein ACRC3H_24580 [Lachnospiraceae bacterium]